jgi:CO dehydrogenase maturation factor
MSSLLSCILRIRCHKKKSGRNEGIFRISPWGKYNGNRDFSGTGDGPENGAAHTISSPLPSWCRKDLPERIIVPAAILWLFYAQERVLMKIAVSGKGGTGKTFIAGTLAAMFVKAGKKVIALDADSSPNLAVTLGLSPQGAAAIVPVAENEQLIRRKTGTEFPGVFRLTCTVDDIISSGAIPTPTGVNLVVMGTVRSMGAGCMCAANSLLRALLRHLVVESDELVILDMEAGMEHLGRGTAEHVDLLMVVTDANRTSLDIAGRICGVAAKSAIANIGLVGNRITGPDQEEVIRQFAEKNRLTLLAFIPFDQQVSNAGITGSAVDGQTSPALAALRRLADRLVKTGGALPVPESSGE